MEMALLNEILSMIKVWQYFGTCLLIAHTMWPKQSKLRKVPTVVDSIVVVGALTLCIASFRVICNLHRWTWSLILELMFYKFKLSHNVCRSNSKHLCERWRHNWSQYSNQKVQEILLRMPEPRSGKPKRHGFWNHTLIHKSESSK